MSTIAELDLVQWIFAPLMPFIAHPGRIVAFAVLWFVAAVILTLWRKKVAWAPLVTGVCWALFAAWEQHCVTLGYYIRVDLILIYPLLVAFTIFGAFGLFVTDPQQFTIRRQFSLRALLILTTLVAVALGGVFWLSR